MAAMEKARALSVDVVELEVTVKGNVPHSFFASIFRPDTRPAWIEAAQVVAFFYFTADRNRRYPRVRFIYLNIYPFTFS